jgi:predicted ribosome quality control (RQC) complex YloA/Tae2 family protein
MALRKNLGNGKIINIKQHEFERTIIIKIDTNRGEFQLAVEFFSEGNIILISPENKILHALVYKRMRDRNILRGENFQYAPPSGKNPFKTSREDLNEIKNFGQLEIVKALTRFLSIGGLYTEEILLRAKVNKNSQCKTLGKRELNKIFAQLQFVLSSLASSKTEPCILADESGNWVDVTPIRLKRHEQFQIKAYGKFNEALDEFYTKTKLAIEMTQTTREFERQLAKLQRVLKRQQKALEDSKIEVPRNKKLGELIYTHLGELQLLQQRIMNEKERGKTWKQIISDLEKEKEEKLVPAPHFHALDSKRRILTVLLEDSTLQLNLTRSIQANAAKFYEKAKKAQRKIEGAKKALHETKAKIEQLQQKKQQIVNVKKPPTVRKEKAWYEKFRWFHSSDGLLVIGGKDATTNEILIKKHMESHDIVLHADIVGAPFVLVKTQGKTPSEQSLKQAAQFAASYSRAWKEAYGAIDVYWMHPRQVSKSPPSGQYLKKGSFRIHGAKNYIRNVPLAVAIGVQIKNQAKIIGGPPEAISKLASAYVELVPGEQKSGQLAKQVRNIMAQHAPEDWRKQILEVSLEEIQVFIPSGKGNIKPVQKRR